VPNARLGAPPCFRCAVSNALLAARTRHGPSARPPCGPGKPRRCALLHGGSLHLGSWQGWGGR
jgi:hypothetical protein